MRLLLRRSGGEAHGACRSNEQVAQAHRKAVGGIEAVSKRMKEA
jgi:hypothetical protein